jgi:HlyD family secretion protein
MTVTARKGQGAKRWWLWGVAGVVVVVLIVLAMMPAPIEVDLAGADRGPLQITLDEEGETRVRDRYMVSAPVSGRVLRIQLEPGDPVVADETVLVTLRPAQLDERTRAEAQARAEAAKADLGLARAEFSRAQTEYRFAQSEYERVNRLAQEQIASGEMLDAAQLRVDTGREAEIAAKFAVSTAEHRLAQARATLVGEGDSETTQKPITILSPIGGVVLRRLRESSAVVAAGEPLIEVADPSRLEIVSDFLSEDAVRIPAGAPVLIERWGGERSLRGRVRRVEPFGFTKISALGVEEQRVNVVIDFEDAREAWNALGDGYRVEVRVVVWESQDVLRVPTSSLFRSGSGWAAFTVSDGDAHLTELQIGRRNGLTAEVLSGLDAGDRVILYPSDAVADGVSVKER